MLNNEPHRLLRRQLNKSGLNILDKPEYATFLNMVNEAYKSFDKDVKHIENILELSSKELFIANQKLIFERDNTLVKLEQIVNNVGGVIFETDLKGNFTYLNNAWSDYSGIAINDALGKNYKDFLASDNIEGLKRLNQLFTQKKEKLEFIFKHKRKGVLMWFEVKFKLIKDVNKTPIGFIGTIIDITELKETEIELKRASEAKDAFLSTMSHEIRTPLNAVTGLANILLMEDYLSGQEDNLKALKYSGEHLLGLINDLLDFNKIKSGKIQLIEKDFSLKYLLENIKSHFDLKIREKGLTFIINQEKGVPNSIIGDRLKLTQIVKNLLSNAIKFTENGSITLTVKNLGIESNKVKLQFMVSDTGIGIAKNKLSTIFESFMQANSETSVKYGGSGLGLSISKKLLNLQNSDFEVTSKKGEGSNFSFVIEYKISNRLNMYEPEMIKMQPNYDPLNINVLVAEDNKMNTLILKRFFEKWKVTYEIAENGNGILHILENTDITFDVILMDLQMPELNGYQTTKIIRNMSNKTIANIPIIALTAFAQTDIKAKTERYKMNGFMGKPFNPVELYSLLKSYHKAQKISNAS